MTTNTDLIDIWPEFMATIVFILSFLIAIMAQNLLIQIVTALCVGAISARIIYIKNQRQPIGPYLVICIFAIFGFILAYFASNFFIIIFSIFGAFILSYYLHKKKIIQTFKSKQFIK